MKKNKRNLTLSDVKAYYKGVTFRICIIRPGIGNYASAPELGTHSQPPFTHTHMHPHLPTYLHIPTYPHTQLHPHPPASTLPHTPTPRGIHNAGGCITSPWAEDGSFHKYCWDNLLPICKDKIRSIPHASYMRLNSRRNQILSVKSRTKIYRRQKIIFDIWVKTNFLNQAPTVRKKTGLFVYMK